MSIDWSRMRDREALEHEALEQARQAARLVLGQLMHARRSALITALPGQEMLYIAKEAEARSWLSDPRPELARHPLLAAEIGLSAPDADSLARLWVARAEAWRLDAAEIERLRLRLGAEIEAATSPDALDALRARLEAGDLGQLATT